MFDMIEYILNPNIKSIDWSRISELFKIVEWGYRPPEEIEQAFKQSTVTIFLYDNEELIGFGRTVDDGKYYALLVDVVIHPDYQGKGLGKKLVHDLRTQLQGYEFITLTAAPKKDGFYHKIGWKKQSSSFIYPKDAKQAEEHCE